MAKHSLFLQYDLSMISTVVDKDDFCSINHIQLLFLCILADIGASENAIIAGLMCDILKKTNIGIKELEGNFSTEVLTILKGVSDFDISSGLENDDIILVKLAERLHNMRTLKFMDESRWRIKAKETVEMYMPIARKFGNNALTEEMNKLVLEYL